MPGAEQLPPEFGRLAYRNGFELSHNRWDSDAQELMRRLGLGRPDGAPAAVVRNPPRRGGRGSARQGGAPCSSTGVIGMLRLSAAASNESLAPAAVAITTPVGAQHFSQALGLQMSVFARDGIQQAELHLNPAEMGPVSVQIVMDGTQARIDFGADVAATRHAIEAGLPELASALRDAGFTLAGGGVSQHAGHSRSNPSDGGREGRDNDDRAPRGGAATDETIAHVASAAQRIVTAGGVDLFA